MQDIPEATVVDAIFAVVLFVFKMASKIPMSTTWCFVGLLAGRELTMYFRGTSKMTLKEALFVSAKDLVAVIVGFMISLAVGAGANEHVREGVKMTFSSG